MSAKPPPPEAPRVLQEVGRIQDSERRVESSPNQNRSSEEKDANTVNRNSQASDEGKHTLGFGWNTRVTYDEAWSGISSESTSMDTLLRECDLNDDRVLKFVSWIHRKKGRDA